jgi:hypothetical protein
VAAGDQVAVPAQDRVGAYQQPQAAKRCPRKGVEQRGQQGPVGWLEGDALAAKVTLRHRELVS